ncbi:MAG TPA: hemerythrin domain-containing protein [Kofleriaceae bacterium]|nr:hemerythrin domain-containing protein [Kofleriaceae bacterium]
MSRDNDRETTPARRLFLQGVVSAAGVAVVGCAATAAAARNSGSEKDAHGEAEVTPGEDLMQEHGILERILLIYDEATRRIAAGEALDVSVVARAADIVHRFVEDYHEKLEETFVFPRLEAAHRQTELVATLRLQHQRGRDVTDEIAGLATGSGSPKLAAAMTRFARMYRPHAAREDTVLFPAFRDLLGRDAYRELGEQFEDQEHERFGEDGFAKTVAEVATLETTLGIFDLTQFPP